MEIKPTVGRMVYYKTYGTPGGEHPPEECAAIITEVMPEGLVSLCVLYPNGMSFKRAVAQGQNSGQWDWMPFQKDQQARLAPGTRNESHPEPTS
jgi:hypothetical protein